MRCSRVAWKRPMPERRTPRSKSGVLPPCARSAVEAALAAMAVPVIVGIDDCIQGFGRLPAPY